MSGDFWSRRLAGVKAEQQVEDAARRETERAAVEAELAQKDDAEILESLGLPEPEALGSPEAVREFLNAAVPQRLKSRALRRLWRLNPVLANLDGLVDYGEDYTDAATVMDNLQTAYCVGKGMLAHVEELARRAEDDSAAPAEEPAAAEDALIAMDQDDLVTTDQDDLVIEDQPAPVADAPDLLAYDDAAPVSLAPRRMHFRFEDHA